MKFRSRVAILPCKLMQKLVELSCSCPLVQVVLQGSVILYSMPSVLVVMAIKALVSSGQVLTHLIGAFEIGLILNFLQYVIYWFFKQ